MVVMMIIFPPGTDTSALRPGVKVFKVTDALSTETYRITYVLGADGIWYAKTLMDPTVAAQFITRSLARHGLRASIQHVAWAGTIGGPLGQ